MQGRCAILWAEPPADSEEGNKMDRLKLKSLPAAASSAQVPDGSMHALES